MNISLFVFLKDICFTVGKNEASRVPQLSFAIKLFLIYIKSSFLIKAVRFNCMMNTSGS